MELTIETVKHFIKERENVRLGKGTDDYVINNSRFCNIHREHDKVSKWIFENCSSIAQVMLARLVNRIDLLEELQECQWNMETFIQREGPVTNAGAYQFYPKKGETMRDILLDIDNQQWYLSKIMRDMADLSIKDLAESMSFNLGRPLHFYWMMVILDCGQMGLLDVDMNSEPYAGPGGHKVTKALGVNLNELAELLDVPPYTAEHIACEVRKYVDRHNNGIPNNRKR